MANHQLHIEWNEDKLVEILEVEQLRQCYIYLNHLTLTAAIQNILS